MTIQLLEVKGSCPRHPAVEDVATIDLSGGVAVGLATLIELDYGFNELDDYDLCVFPSGAIVTGHLDDEAFRMHFSPLPACGTPEEEELPLDGCPREWPIDDNEIEDELYEQDFDVE